MMAVSSGKEQDIKTPSNPPTPALIRKTVEKLYKSMALVFPLISHLILAARALKPCPGMVMNLRIKTKIALITMDVLRWLRENKEVFPNWLLMISFDLARNINCLKKCFNYVALNILDKIIC